jgi:hypothetical protein
MAFTEGCVVLLKYHPLMRPVAPYIDYVLEPLARRGFFASSANPGEALQLALTTSLVDSCLVSLESNLQLLNTRLCPHPTHPSLLLVAAAELAVTQHMLYSPLTDCVHMTGGTATHDAIVWGADPAEQARRRAANDPVLKVRGD